MSGIMFSVEGVDGVGKNTQSKLMRDYLISLGRKCDLYSFPRYETETGKRIGQYLNSTEDLNNWDVAKLFIEDRKAVDDEIRSKLNDGIDIVCDRFSLSNGVYFAANLLLVALNSIRNSGKDTSDFLTDPYTNTVANRIISDVFHEEHVKNNVIVPDSTIVLSMSPEHAAKQVFKKDTRVYTDKKQDRNESNAELQTIVNAIYSTMLDNRTNIKYKHNLNVTVVDCELFVADNYIVKSIDAIHKEVVKIVDFVIKQK